MQYIKPLRNETVLTPKNIITDYIIDLITLIRTLKDIQRNNVENCYNLTFWI